MTKFVGRLATMGIARETTRGTLVTTPTFWIPQVSADFDDKSNKVVENEGLGKICDSDSSYVVSRFGEGNITAQLRDNGMGLILYALMGSWNNVLVEAGVWRHSFAIANNNTHPSLTITLNEVDNAYQFPLSMVDEFKLTVEPEGIVEYEVGFKSRQSVPCNPKTPSISNLGNKFLHQHLRFKIASTIAGLTGASETVIKKLELTIKKNVLADFTLGTVQADDNMNQEFAVEGNLVINRNNDTFKNLAMGTDYQAMQIQLSGADLGTTSQSALTLQFPRVAFSEWEADRSLEKIVTEKINFKGHYDAANGLACISTCDLTNTQNTY